MQDTWHNRFKKNAINGSADLFLYSLWDSRCRRGFLYNCILADSGTDKLSSQHNGFAVDFCEYTSIFRIYTENFILQIWAINGYMLIWRGNFLVRILVKGIPQKWASDRIGDCYDSTLWRNCVAPTSLGYFYPRHSAQEPTLQSCSSWLQQFPCRIADELYMPIGV